MKSFAEIYSNWSQTHNETNEMRKKYLTEGRTMVNAPTVNELRKMKVQADLDLHNYVLEEALPATKNFMENSFRLGLRKVRIVTGKGLHSPNGEAVLRPAVISFLSNCKYVREVETNPCPADGGSGAIIVTLKLNLSDKKPYKH